MGSGIVFGIVAFILILLAFIYLIAILLRKIFSLSKPMSWLGGIAVLVAALGSLTFRTYDSTLPFTKINASLANDRAEGSAQIIAFGNYSEYERQVGVKRASTQDYIIVSEAFLKNARAASHPGHGRLVECEARSAQDPAQTDEQIRSRRDRLMGCMFPRYYQDKNPNPDLNR